MGYEKTLEQPEIEHTDDCDDQDCDGQCVYDAEDAYWELQGDILRDERAFDD